MSCPKCKRQLSALWGAVAALGAFVLWLTILVAYTVLNTASAAEEEVTTFRAGDPVTYTMWCSTLEGAITAADPERENIISTCWRVRLPALGVHALLKERVHGGLSDESGPYSIWLAAPWAFLTIWGISAGPETDVYIFLPDDAGGHKVEMISL